MPLILEVLDSALFDANEYSIEKALEILNGVLFFSTGIDDQLMFYFPVICYLITGKPDLPF